MNAIMKDSISKEKVGADLLDKALTYKKKWEHVFNFELKDSEKLRTFFKENPNTLDLFIKHLENEIALENKIDDIANSLTALINCGAITAIDSTNSEKTPIEITKEEAQKYKQIIQKYKETLNYLTSLKE